MQGAAVVKHLLWNPISNNMELSYCPESQPSTGHSLESIFLHYLHSLTLFEV